MLPEPSLPARFAATPGALAAALAPYLSAGRLERMRAVLARRTRWLVPVLDRLYDPNNVAACMRTADALGLQDVHVVQSERVSPLGLRPSHAVSLDAERWLTTFAHAPDALPHALAGHALVVTTLDGADTTLDALPLGRPLAVVFGSERAGASRELLAAAAYRMALPMRGFGQSLNVSVAFGIVMTRLRERLEAERHGWALPEPDALTLLDGWVYRDVAHADAILAELARRA